jgi:cell wall-associated NlpC family hydrolase
MTHFAGKAAKVFFLSALTTLLLAVSAMAAEGDIAVRAGVTTGSSLRLRAEASTSSSILTTLNKDITLAVLDQPVLGWYKVAYAGKIGFVSTDYVALDEDNIFETYGRVSADAVNVRTDTSTESDTLGTISGGSIVTVNGLLRGWYDVTCESGTRGYIRSDFVDLISSASSANGSSVVALAQQYLGTRYVYGGAAPGAFDCSGYTMYIMKQFGYNLPHTATGQWQSGYGTKVSYAEMMPGDLVFFCDPSRSLGKACSHVGIYVGNGQFIHASSSKNGVIYSDLTSGYYHNYFVGAIRMA